MTAEKTPDQVELNAMVAEAAACLPDGLVVYGPNYEVLFANERSRRDFKATLEALEGGATFLEASVAGILALYPDLPRDVALETARALHDRYDAGLSTELETPSGRIVQVVARRMSNGNRLMVGADVTELRMREEEVRSARDAAEKANQAKTTFLANISHEIRTPLNAVLGMAQVLESGSLSSEQKEQVAAIIESGKTLLATLNDVLDLSKIESGRFEICPVEEDPRLILNRVHRLWEPMARERDLGFALNIDPALPDRLRFDPVRVTQCTANLISNALKFTPRGRVTVDVGFESAAPGEPCAVTIAVRDTGIGMDREIVDKLFQPFEQGDASISRRFGGTGLGLVICRQLAELMGGTVTVESERGVGSCFTFRFQAQSLAEATPVPEVSAATPAAPRRWQNGLRILLADDHPLNRKIVRLFLEPLGAQITEVEDGGRALERLTDGEPFDLVLLDSHMPHLDGRETIKRIREGKAGRDDIPVIAITADAMSGDRERYLGYGMDGYVSKPIDQRTLISEINSVLFSGKNDARAIAAGA